MKLLSIFFALSIILSGVSIGQFIFAHRANPENKHRLLVRSRVLLAPVVLFSFTSIILYNFVQPPADQRFAIFVLWMIFFLAGLGMGSALQARK